ncbi:lytic transglycosylase domain-containing protein [Stenotrophomonas sp. C3(2023)]|uniref:lytic transglycosylase domain-containing protein n=1 Tax=Stenotrophomonas sp. C3(2023) TaxID=3080277 RepID=UPI00293C87A7|nr:lytic transglycosylase domain-containing protein [Stenotrophomonas sp. C3(2023)]MDV3468456.1 lytic transglycosylase domain-containing protein [Stenotrophomonas sp. C3(2023)]
MVPGLEQLACPDLAVPASIMHHVVQVESSYNPYAIGVVGGRLARQPRTLDEAVATARMLEDKGYNFSLGLAQVNRHNLRRQGLDSYEVAFGHCANVQAGARILADCHARAKGDWGKAFSCYYSGNFSTGFKHGYVQKVFASMQAAGRSPVNPIPLADGGPAAPRRSTARSASSLLQARTATVQRPAISLADERSRSALTGGIARATTPLHTGEALAVTPSANDDAPVVLQPHGAAPTGTAGAPPPIPPPATRGSDPLVDAAFVF